MPAEHHQPPVWQEDEAVSECFHCSTKFSFFYRRHHCRRCGRVVCGACSQTHTLYEPGSTVVSPPNSMFLEPDYIPHRTCDACVEELLLAAVFVRDFEGEVVLRAGPLVLPYEDPSSSSTGGGTCPMEVPARQRKDQSEQVTVTIDGTENGDNDSERDRCPVCGVLLRGKDEHDREDHINTCLVDAEFSGSPEHPRGTSNRMLVYYVPFPDKDQQVVISCSDASNASGSTPTQGEKQLPHFEECVICLEDLDPGDKVGRLECLCVFHYKCIKAWFKRKGPGDCPVHAVHV